MMYDNNHQIADSIQEKDRLADLYQWYMRPEIGCPAHHAALRHKNHALYHELHDVGEKGFLKSKRLQKALIDFSGHTVECPSVSSSDLGTDVYAYDKKPIIIKNIDALLPESVSIDIETDIEDGEPMLYITAHHKGAKPRAKIEFKFALDSVKAVVDGTEYKLEDLKTLW